MKLYRFIFILFLFHWNSFYSQESQAQLEAERKQLRNQIVKIESLQKNSQRKEKSVLVRVQVLTQKVNTLDRLIKLTNRQANYLTHKIKENTSRIKQLALELETAKTDYAEMIKKSYKSKSVQNRILFLLSSESFSQAYKRFSYMKQYAKYRKKQGVSILEKTEVLKKLNTQLVEQQKQKEQLVVENRKSKIEFAKEKQIQQKLIADIKKNQSTYARQIKAQERKAREIDRKIEKLIREAIAKSNKKRGNRKNTKTFALTAEAKVLARNFSANRGKLPWPVVKGKVIKRFGKQRHPLIPNIQINNSGVDIETNEDELVRTIFEGEVSTVQAIKGAGKLVQIRHGNIITTYYNIENITVKEGDKVKTKQSIGSVHTNSSTGKTIMKFLIYQNSKFLNPQKWIYRM